MIRTSLQRRSAGGSAADTAASPPTRTKSSISVVRNKTFKARPRTSRDDTDARMGPTSLPVTTRARGQRSYANYFPVDAAQFRVTATNQNEWPQRPKEFHAMTIAGNDQRNLTGSFTGLRVLDFS